MNATSLLCSKVYLLDSLSPLPVKSFLWQNMVEKLLKRPVSLLAQYKTVQHSCVPSSG